MSLSQYDSPNGSYTSSIPSGTAAFRKVVAEFFEYSRTEVVRDLSRCRQTRSEHCECRAIDLFTTLTVKGRRLFDWCVLHADALGIESVIFQHREIGFGNPTERHREKADHMDHVHVGFTRVAARTLTEAKVRALLPGQEDDVTDADHAKIAAAITAATKPLADRLAEVEKVLGVGQPYAAKSNVMKALMRSGDAGSNTYTEEVHDVYLAVQELLKRP